MQIACNILRIVCAVVGVCDELVTVTVHGMNNIKLLSPEILFFLILAHPVYKM